MTRTSPAPDPSTKHEIRPGQSIELLKELHILTRDGKMNQDSRRKLKQVYHVYQFIEPLLADVHERQRAVSLVDQGAGKSLILGSFSTISSSRLCVIGHTSMKSRRANNW